MTTGTTSEKKSLTASNSQAPGTTSQFNCAEFPAVAQPISHYAAKRQARLQAVAALQGVALHRLANGGWLASRWNLNRELEDAQIEAWLRQIGGKP